MWILYVFVWRMFAQVGMRKRWKIVGDRISVEKCLKWNLGSETKLCICCKIDERVILLVKSKHCFYDNPLSIHVNFLKIPSEKQSRPLACLGLNCSTAVRLGPTYMQPTFRSLLFLRTSKKSFQKCKRRKANLKHGRLCLNDN